LTPNKEGKTPLEILKSVIESVAPGDIKNISLKHLKHVEQSLL
jgi:hypothetical protein